MNRREFLRNGPMALLGMSAPAPNLDPKAREGRGNDQQTGSKKKRESLLKPRDFRKEPFRRLVILGESMVSGGIGRWLQTEEQRYADVVARLINSCQEKPIEYINKG